MPVYTFTDDDGDKRYWIECDDCYAKVSGYHNEGYISLGKAISIAQARDWYIMSYGAGDTDYTCKCPSHK